MDVAGTDRRLRRWMSAVGAAFGLVVAGALAIALRPEGDSRSGHRIAEDFVVILSLGAGLGFALARSNVGRSRRDRFLAAVAAWFAAPPIGTFLWLVTSGEWLSATGRERAEVAVGFFPTVAVADLCLSPLLVALGLLTGVVLNAAEAASRRRLERG